MIILCSCLLGFRPLSRGLFFNWDTESTHRKTTTHVFVPFLGDFFSITECCAICAPYTMFSSPFSGTFFQCVHRCGWCWRRRVFVPFLGDFFSIRYDNKALPYQCKCFRPLSRGLFFNGVVIRVIHFLPWFSSPFSGTFFQYSGRSGCIKLEASCFRPLSRGLFFNHNTKINATLNIGMVFVPFLGDFFSIIKFALENRIEYLFSSPFSGTFFQ